MRVWAVAALTVLLSMDGAQAQTNKPFDPNMDYDEMQRQYLPGMLRELQSDKRKQQDYVASCVKLMTGTIAEDCRKHVSPADKSICGSKLASQRQAEAACRNIALGRTSDLDSRPANNNGVTTLNSVNDLRRLSRGAIEKTKILFQRNIRQKWPEWLPSFNAVEIKTTDEVRPGGIAFMDGNKRVIHLNLGATLVPHIYSEYAAIRTHYGSRHNKKCKNYVEYLGEFYKQHGRSTPERFAAALIRPLQFCEVEYLKADRVFQNQFYDIFEDTFTPVFGLILAHEYAHHLLGHLDVAAGDPERRRALEHEADRKGSEIFGTIASRTRAAIVFSVMASYRSADPFNPDRKAIAEECRFLSYLVDDSRFANIYSLDQLINPIRDRIDIMERIPRLSRELEMLGKGVKIPNCEIIN